MGGKLFKVSKNVGIQNWVLLSDSAQYIGHYLCSSGSSPVMVLWSLAIPLLQSVIFSSFCRRRTN